MKFIQTGLFLFLIQTVVAQTPRLKQSIYRAVLYRPDSNEVVFNFQPKTEKGKTVLYVLNDTERLRITDVKQRGDSLLFNMPVFESSFLTKIKKDGSLQGVLNVFCGSLFMSFAITCKVFRRCYLVGVP